MTTAGDGACCRFVLGAKRDIAGGGKKASQRRLNTRSTTDTRRARVLAQGVGAFCPGTRISRGIEGRSPVGAADPATATGVAGQLFFYT